MSLLDQSVIKKGKEQRASAGAELGEMVQAPQAQTHFLPCGACLLCVAGFSGQLALFIAH